MMRKSVAALCILAFSLVTVSCKKLGEPTKQTGPGPLTYQTLNLTDSIPQDYGPLIGVTQNPDAPGWVRLWFQRSDGTITAVVVNVDQGRIYPRALTIPRK